MNLFLHCALLVYLFIYGSYQCCGSFYHQAKIVRTTFDSYCFVTSFDLSSLKNDVNVPSKSNKQKNLFLISFFWRLEGQWRKKQDPDPLVRGMAPRIRIHTKMSWIHNTGSYLPVVVPGTSSVPVPVSWLSDLGSAINRTSIPIHLDLTFFKLNCICLGSFIPQYPKLGKPSTGTLSRILIPPQEKMFSGTGTVPYLTSLLF